MKEFIIIGIALLLLIPVAQAQMDIYDPITGEPLEGNETYDISPDIATGLIQQINALQHEVHELRSFINSSQKESALFYIELMGQKVDDIDEIFYGYLNLFTLRISAAFIGAILLSLAIYELVKGSLRTRFRKKKPVKGKLK